MHDTAVPVSTGSPRFEVRDLGSCLVTHVWFPAHAVIDVHVHDRPTFAVILAGGFELKLTSPALRRRQITCPPGTILTQPAGEKHANHIVARDSRGVVLQPDLAARDLPARCVSLLGQIHHFRDGPIATAAFGVAREMACPDDVSPIAIEAFVYEMLAEAAQLERQAIVRSGEAPAWLVRAVEFVHDRFRDSIRIDDVAAAAGVHPAHLAAIFRRAHRVPLGRYIRRLRVAWAAERLLRTNGTIAGLAVEAGFADQAHLTRWFRRETGWTPAAYRRSRRSGRRPPSPGVR